LKDIFPEIKNKIISHSVKVGDPYYIGHMTSAIPYFTILVEIIIAALNQNQVKIETAKASTFVEREFLSWIHRLVYNKSSHYYKKNMQNHLISFGNVTIDGTLANLTAMLVARNKCFPAEGDFAGIARAGLVEAYKYYNCEKSVIIISKRGHYSFEKIARICGIGEQNVIKIAVDNNNKIDINELEKVIDEIAEYNSRHEKQIKILSIVGVAGTTETGNIDDLNKLQKISKRLGTHFHVDAAWGGPVLFVDQYKKFFKGIEKADSVTFDCHKLLYTPLSMGTILFRDENDLNSLRHTSDYVIRPESRDLGKFTVEGSRPFTSLKTWVNMNVFGSDGFKLLFEHAFSLINKLKNIVSTHENFEALNYPELFIFNYRFVPDEVQNRLLIYKNENNNKAILAINEVLNKMTIDLHRAIRKADNSFVSRTMLESTIYSPQSIVVITINPLTTENILEEIISEHNQLGLSLYHDKYKNELQAFMG
jgi:glutamate decarboxylase